MVDHHELPDHIYTYEHAAEVGHALADFYGEKMNDETLAHIIEAVTAVVQIRADSRYLDDTTRYGSRVTYVDRDGEPHTGLVMEPEVTSMDAEEAWDPYQEKMVDPRTEYPLGTVQLIYTPDFDLSDGFNFDRLSQIEVATSVTPASGPDDTHTYYAGWDYALNRGSECPECESATLSDGECPNCGHTVGSVEA